MRLLRPSLLAVLSLASCAQDGSDAERFVDEGNAICRRYYAQVDALGRARPGTAEYRERERKRVAYAETTMRELRALEPPEELREERNAVFAAIAAQMRTTERIARATRTSDNLGDLLEQQLREGERVDAALRRVGWRDCVQRN